MTLRTHTDTVAEHRLRGEEVHALVTYHGRHRERPGQRDVHQRDDHAARVGGTALQAVNANVRAEERDVVGHVQNHPYVRVDRVERRGGRNMDVNPHYHRDMTVRK